MTTDLFLGSLQSMADPVMIWDRSLCCVFANQPAHRLLKIKNGRLEGRSLADCFSYFPDRLSVWPDRIQSVFITGEVLTVEDLFRSRDEVHSVVSTFTAVKNADGKTEAVCSLCHDTGVIEERLQAEFKTQKKVEEEYRMILKTTINGFLCIDGQTGRILEVNDSYCRMTGYTRDELLFKPVLDLKMKENQEEALETMKAIKRDGSGHFETVHRCKDGSPVHVEVSCRYNDLGGGRFYAFFFNVSKRRKMEEDLKAANAFLDSVIENIPDMIFVKDAKDLRFIRFNKAGEDLLGFSKSDLLGKNDYDFFPLLEADFFTAKDREVLSGKKLVEIPEEPIHTKEKGTRTLHTKKIPILDKTGEPMFLLGISEDITERKQAEKELLEKTRELLRSNAELEQFAYIASHDLQEPLRMVASYVQLLERRYKGRLDSDADDFIRFAVEGAQRMQGLINALLEFSRIRKNFDPESRTDCNVVLDRVLDNLKIQIEESGALIRRAPLPEVMADPNQMLQLFQNLLNNALKFRGQRAPEITITARREDGEWIFSVSDNGIGIEPDYREKIFHVFQRLHTGERFKGTGIGLAICKKIVEQHGGRIWVDSTYGEGSTFHFSLPMGDTGEYSADAES